MSSTPAFSRLQLAAALLEYDNDFSDPVAPITRAQESAIFAHFRRNPAARPLLPSRKSDFLGVSLPSDTGSVAGRESVLGNRRSRMSRGSIDALRNPFGPDGRWSDEEGDGEEELEVDLTSWGLETLIQKEKGGKSAKGKAKAVTSHHAVPSHPPLTDDGPRPASRYAMNTSRSMSLSGIGEFPGMNNALSKEPSKRRKSFGSPLDLVDVQLSQWPVERPRRLSYSAAQPSSSGLQVVPFPSGSAQPPPPHLVDEARGSRRPSNASRLDPKPYATSRRASLESRVMLNDGPAGEISNETAEAVDNNPFAVRPPSPSRVSRFDPKASAHARTYSTMSRGSKILEQDDPPSDHQEPPRRERKYSTTLELLRPKILVMPSPLQPVTPEQPPPQTQVRDGFMLSTDGPPLPPGARSARRNSLAPALDAANKPPVASNSFTPNPLMNLSLSQMTFRNTLHIGGQRDPYSEVIAGLPRATEDGEQIEFEPPGGNANDNPVPVSAPTAIGPDQTRPAGKLFGKSLIDDLELRKVQMRSKQRVFTGDQRPSMMSREQTRSTLIDPATLNTRPTAQRQSSFGIPGSKQALSKRNSLNAKPLLNFDDEEEKFRSSAAPRMISSRSVFGVDTLWEREMSKLSEIQAQEEKDAEEQKRREKEEEKGKERKKRKKDKKKKGQQEQDPPADYVDAEKSHAENTGPRMSVEPPILPHVTRITGRPPKVTEEAEDDESDDEDALPTNIPDDDEGKWFSDSDEEGPRRTTGVGPRYPRRAQRMPRAENDYSGEEEDVPLSVALGKVVQRATRLQQLDDSDEEKPLSSLLLQKNAANLSANLEGDDDDKPLGLRASGIVNRSRGDDDDTPLALHPEQQRRTQYQIMAQQQQQQQLMMHAQFQNSMFFSPPSMYGSGFFGPPMMPTMPMMMQPPIPAPTPPSVHDANKFGRVDKWRHDVAVEGSL